MKKTIHHRTCRYAKGDNVSNDWRDVTCLHCLNRLYPRGMGARPDWETVKRKVVPRRSYGKGNK